MAVQKSNLQINFAKGLDLKTDPFQVSPGNFLSLQNTIFTKAGLLAKRNGFSNLSALPDTTYSYLTTFAGNLTAIGTNLSAYSQSNQSWVVKGKLNPVEISAQPIIRNNLSQTQADSVTAPNGFICSVYTEFDGTNSVTKYAIVNASTGQNIVAPTQIPVSSGTPTAGAKVFLLGNRFIILFNNLISGTNHLQYVAISTAAPTSVSANTDVASAITSSAAMAWDAVSAGGSLYIAYNTTAGGQSVKVTYLTQTLSLATPRVIAGAKATAMSICADTYAPTAVKVYVTYYDSVATNGSTVVLNSNITILSGPTAVISTTAVNNVTSAAYNGVCTLFYEVANVYSFDSTVVTNYIKSRTITAAGSVGTQVVSIRDAGLASKAFLYNGNIYYLAIQSSPYQPTYFLVDGTASRSSSPAVIVKLAYSNGGNYYTQGLPNVTLIGNVASVSYLFKDLIQAVNKNTNVPAGSQTAGIYSQTGINLVNINFTSIGLDTAEIGNNLHLSGGFLSMYDGYLPVEHGFHLWPELTPNADGSYHGITPTMSGGALTPQVYYYQFTYEWTDNQGNAFKSAPSVPITVDLTNATSNVNFTATFLTGNTTIDVSSTANLYVGQKVINTTTPGNFASDTLITAIDSNANTITLNNAVLGDSAPTGDSVTASTIAVSTTSVFPINATKLHVVSTTGFAVGQVVTDLTTAGNFQSNTTIESVDSVNNIIGISLPTIGASASTPGDTIQSKSVISNIIQVPTYRITAKTANPVKIVGYRWSQSQQVYYQFTSVLNPVLNDTTVDSISITDTASDAAILGNNIIYTTGGVVENIAAPATNIMTLFDTRLFIVDAEDPNLLWYSKQVIEATPAEMSDLFTIYIAPSTGAQGSTGPITALSVLDDKLIIFKKNAIYYMNGSGPDNTGANSQYSQPVFITSTVGCTNINSIVFMPNGLMFQSDKGIWLLDRNLTTSYIGAAVETLTESTSVVSALNIPGTNQVRFTMASGITLMYDYFYQQWGSFTGINAQSSTIYQNLHTFISSTAAVFQEAPGKYLDGGNPVLMSFTTGWMSLAGLQGFERAYFFYLLGTYITPHRLNIQISYDFQPTPTQTSVIQPDNYAAAWGSDSNWGGSQNWGGSDSIEQWRVFMNQQKCQSFQLSIQEVFDSSLGVQAGAGLTLSGIDLVVGVKKGYPTLRPSRSVG